MCSFRRIIGPCYREVWLCFSQGSGISKLPVLSSHDSDGEIEDILASRASRNAHILVAFLSRCIEQHLANKSHHEKITPAHHLLNGWSRWIFQGLEAAQELDFRCPQCLGLFFLTKWRKGWLIGMGGHLSKTHTLIKERVMFWLTDRVDRELNWRVIWFSRCLLCRCMIWLF